jgi:Aspartyl protease
MRCAASGLALLISLTQAGFVLPAYADDFPFRLRAGLIWVQVEGPRGGKPLNFILDSGAEASVMDLETARHLDLELSQSVTVRGINTTSLGYWTEPWVARVGGVSSLTNHLAMDLSALSADCHHQVDGLIGADFFAKRVVQIDFINERIRLLSNYKPGDKAEILPLQIEASKLRVPVEVVDFGQGWARLDTGCAASLRWTVTKAMLASHDSPKELGVGVSSQVIRRHTQSVRLGGLTLDHVSTGLQSEALMPGEAALLGAGLLSRFSMVTINEPAGQLVLEGFSNPKPPSRR